MSQEIQLSLITFPLLLIVIIKIKHIRAGAVLLVEIIAEGFGVFAGEGVGKEIFAFAIVEHGQTISVAIVESGDMFTLVAVGDAED